MMICDQKLPPRSSCGPEYEASTHNVIHLVQKAGGEVQHTAHRAACKVTPPLALGDSRNSAPKRGEAAEHAVSLLQYGACELYISICKDYMKYSLWTSDNSIHCGIGTAYLCTRGSESPHCSTCNIGVLEPSYKHFRS